MEEALKMQKENSKLSGRGNEKERTRNKEADRSKKMIKCGMVVLKRVGLFYLILNLFFSRT